MVRLVEGIKEVQKLFPNIPEDKFFELIKLDPTYKDGVDSVGTYGKWILNLYNKKRVKDEDLYKIPDYLKDFEKKKKGFKNKDINQFKSLPDLAKALEEVNVELSQNQKNRAFKKEYKNANLDAELVYQNGLWQVWIPLTYNSSCKLAEGTEWCTGPSSHGDDYYYNRYTEEGPLYINIFDEGTEDEEKYQFHFPTHQFMDRYDKPIDLVDFLNSPGQQSLKPFYVDLLKKKCEDVQSLNDLWENISDFIYSPDFEEELNKCLNEMVIEINSTQLTANSRDMSDEFYRDCFGGDLFHYFDTYDPLTKDDLEGVLISISDKTMDTLELYGFPKNTFELLIADELPEKYDYWAEDLYDALSDGAWEGEVIGAETDALADFRRAVYTAIPKGLMGEIVYDGLNISNITPKYIYDNKDDINDALDYYSQYFKEALEECIVNQINDNIIFREPYSGWYGFDEDAFNDKLQEEIMSFSRYPEK